MKMRFGLLLFAFFGLFFTCGVFADGDTRGCCYDDATGIYDKNVIEDNCDFDWVADPNCNLPGAAMGCCILEDEHVFQTIGQCEVDSIALALGGSPTMDWRNDVGEVECILGSKIQREGACVVNGADCEINSEAWCVEHGGDFNEGLLCSAPELGTNCNMSEETSCIDGKVYFLDSCGNPANIYDSSRATDEEYWTSVVNISDSCMGAEGSGDSKSCGNCEPLEGGICSSAIEDGFNVNMGDFYCRSTDCEFQGTMSNEVFKNGEAWCDYDGTIANGQDAPGSRHWRYNCVDGEVEIEACADARNEICHGGVCVANSWATCLAMNAEGANSSQCSDMRRCILKTVEIGSDFAFDICVPSYPIGEIVNESESAEKANVTDMEDVCNIGTQNCTIYYQRNWKGDWECAANCKCDDQNFTDQMNEVCRSLGDCGGYANYINVYTDGGFEVNMAPENISEDLIESYKVGGKGNRGVGEINDNESVGTLLDFLRGGDESKGTDLDYLYMNNLMFEIKGAFGIFSPSSFGYETLTDLGIGDDFALVIDPWGAFMSKTKKKVSTFECKPWEPPEGGEDCYKCNEDPMKPCSEYRCKTLGAACKMTDIGGEGEKCVGTGSNDTSEDSSFTISPWEGGASDGIKYEEISSSGFELVDSEGNCLAPNTRIKFGITTSVEANCRFDIEDKVMDSMDFAFGAGGYTENHQATFELPDPDHLEEFGDNFTWDGNTFFYIKCKDVNGVENDGSYVVGSCTGDDGRDRTVPIAGIINPVTRSIFPNGATNNIYAGFDATSYIASVVVNELSTCRWSLEDTTYENMTNEMNCDDTLGVRSSNLGYLCTYNFPLNNDTSTYYVRCMDQPWLNGTGNANERSIVFTISKPAEKIYIESVSPNEDFEVGTEFATIDLRVESSEGAGSHSCSYSFSGYSDMLEMVNSNGYAVNSLTLSVESGKKKLYVECVDDAGDIAQEMVEFEIFRDSASAGISRIWNERGNINMVLTEEGECRFSTENCKFLWDNGILIGSGTEMSIVGSPGDRYYIRCMDGYGNAPNGCSVDVVAS